MCVFFGSQCSIEGPRNVSAKSVAIIVLRTHSVLTKDALFFILYSYSAFPPKFALACPRGNKRHRIETLTQRAERSLTYFAGVLGRQTFPTAANIRYSSQLQVLQGDVAM